MITKNFYNSLAAVYGGQTIANALTAIDGNTYPAANKLGTAAHSMYYLSLATGESGGVRIGKGNTPATIDDYNLESQITSGVSITNPSSTSVGLGDGCTEWACTYGVTNTSTTEVKISEIGLFSWCYTSSSAQKLCLLDRTVLGSPITLNPGETKQLTYTIRMNYPTA